MSGAAAPDAPPPSAARSEARAAAAPPPDAPSPRAPAPAPPPPSPSAGARARRLLWTALKLGLAAALIAWLARSGRIRAGELLAALGSPRVVALCLGLLGTTIVISAARWRLLLGAVGVSLRWREVFEVTLIGNFFNTVMPGSVGGDPIKALYATRHAAPGRKVEAATTIFVDRVIGLVTLVLLALVGIAILPALSGADTVSRVALRELTGRVGPAALALAGLGALLVLPLVAIPSVRRSERLRALAERVPFAPLAKRAIFALAGVLARPRVVAGAVLLSALAHLATIAVFVSLARALGPAPTLGQHLVIVPLGLTINAIPGPPQGLGVGEVAFESLYGLALGVRPSNGATICLLWRILLSSWHLVGGLAYVAYRRPDASWGPPSPPGASA